eukprot:4607142-Pyramimonas_sp.AAC.1
MPSRCRDTVRRTLYTSLSTPYSYSPLPPPGSSTWAGVRGAAIQDWLRHWPGPPAPLAPVLVASSRSSLLYSAEYVDSLFSDDCRQESACVYIAKYVAKRTLVLGGASSPVTQETM